MGLTCSAKTLLPAHPQQHLHACPRSTHSKATPHSGLRGEGEEDLGFKSNQKKKNPETNMEDKTGEAMKICWDGREKSHQNIFKNQEFQSVWNLKLLFPLFCLHKEFLLFRDMEHEKQHPLCPEKGSLPPLPTHLNNSTIYQKEIIYTLTTTPPSLFSILQRAGGRTANRDDFWLKSFFPPSPPSISLQSVVHLLHRSLFQQLFETCKRNESITNTAQTGGGLCSCCLFHLQIRHRGPMALASSLITHFWITGKKTRHQKHHLNNKENLPKFRGTAALLCSFNIPASRNKTK